MGGFLLKRTFYNKDILPFSNIPFVIARSRQQMIVFHPDKNSTGRGRFECARSFRVWFEKKENGGFHSKWFHSRLPALSMAAAN
jgi:hypothetical protein